jgi:AP-1-like factor
MGLIPVELDIEGLYEDHDRRRRKNGNEKIVASHVHSVCYSFDTKDIKYWLHQRRRAQNRASQRAFRDRKEKHMRDLEQRLGELEGRHNDLSRSYESLQVEYSSVKQELDRLRKEKGDASSTNSPESVGNSDQKVWNESGVEGLDPLLFDVSAYCFEQESGQRPKE